MSSIGTENRLTGIEDKSFGLHGADVLNTASGATTENYDVLQCLEDTTFTALVATNLTGDLTAITLSAGMIVYLQVTSLTIASGTVLAYRSAPVQ